MSAAPFTIRVCDWIGCASALRRVRHEVFVVEQHVPEVLEWDDADAHSIHALAEDPNGLAIGCARLLPDGHIGRVAVIREWRGRHVGESLLLRLIGEAERRGDARAIVNAQVAAIPFYERYGFVVTGDEFEEAGIAHRPMERSLASAPAGN